jgi:Tfp pilus assembly protein PilN
MNRLALDFAPRSVRYWWARSGAALRAALVGATLALSAGLWWAMEIQSDRLQLQQALARTAPAAVPPPQQRTLLAAKGALAIDAAQAKAMNRALVALNRPWPELWDALERVSSAAGVQVAILEMRPDSAASDQDPGLSQGLRLLAESKDSAHMLGFMRRLRAEPFFVSAVLSSHQVNAQDPNMPLRFEVMLSWMQASP